MPFEREKELTSADQELLLLLSSDVRERAGQLPDREIGRSGAIGYSANDRRRETGERQELANIALAHLFAHGDGVCGGSSTIDEFGHPAARLGDGGQKTFGSIVIDAPPRLRLANDPLAPAMRLPGEGNGEQSNLG